MDGDDVSNNLQSLLCFGIIILVKTPSGADLGESMLVSLESGCCLEQIVIVRAF